MQNPTSASDVATIKHKSYFARQKNKIYKLRNSEIETPPIS